MTVRLIDFPTPIEKFSTLVELLSYRAQNQPEQKAYTFLQDGETQETSLTYRGLDIQARAIATYLQSLKASGERALLLYPPGLEFITGFFGCLYAGVIAVPAYPPRPNINLSRLQAMVTDAQATLALTTKSLLANLESRWTENPELTAMRWLSTDNIDSNFSLNWQEPRLEKNTLAFLQYTSGSTGIPKGVMISHSNLLCNERAIKVGFGHTEKTIFVGWLPLFHDMGLIGNVLQPLYLGIPSIFMSPVAFLQKPFLWLQAISRYKATTSGGPNFAYDLCVRKITPEQCSSLDLSSWEVAFNGAESVRAETLDCFANYFAPYGFRREAFYPCYGMAEATLFVSGGLKTSPPVLYRVEAAALEENRVMAAANLEEGTRTIVGCGHSWLDEKITIADPESLTECIAGKVGEIWVSGSSVACGYWRRAKQTAETFQAYLVDTGKGPFLRTGDLGFWQDGELFITGRLKDVIIIRGRNHYPQDIELTAEKSHPALRPNASAAFSVDVDRTEQLVIACEVERSYRRKLDIAKVAGAIRQAVWKQHELKVYTLLLLKTGSIPKTSSGKIQRLSCKAGFLGGNLNVLHTSNLNKIVKNISEQIAKQPLNYLETSPYTAKSIENWLREWIVNELEVEFDTIDGHKSFAEYGLDSVTTVRLVSDLNNWLEREILFSSTILDYPYIASLSQYLAQKVNILTSTSSVSREEILQTTSVDKELILDSQFQNGSLQLQEDSTDIHIASEYYNFNLFPEYRNLRQRLEQIELTGYNPYFRVNERVSNNTTVINGRELINYSSYDYLGMSGDPVVSSAVQDAIARYGTSVSASRVTSGEKPLHRELERELANLVGAEDCIVYVGGHATNVTTIGHLFGAKDLIIHDSLIHNSILEGCSLSGSKRLLFPHNDWQALDKLLCEQRYKFQRVLVAIEGIYSADGDIPDLPKFIELKKRHKVFLMVDEAHSIGVLGNYGRGIGEYYRVESTDVDLWMGTLSKSFASCGGYIAGSKALVEYLKYTAPGFLYSVGISPADAAAALAAIRLLKAQPERVVRLHERAKLFLELASERKLDTGRSQNTPVVPVIVGNSSQCIQLSQALFEDGINVQPMISPSVPDNSARLRFFINCTHTEEQIRFTLDVLTQKVVKILR